MPVNNVYAEKNNNESIQIKDGKELVEKCVRLLKDRRSGDSGGNLALYPVVIVFMGEITCAHVQDVKSILDDNWNNAGFLSYVSIKKTEDDYTAETLFPDKEHPAINGKPQSVIGKAVERMLEEDDKIFGKRDSIKIEVLMDSAEEDAVSYYGLYRELNAGANNPNLKSMYLMLDERADSEKKTEELLKHIVKQSKTDKEYRICLISNALSNNQRLSERDIWKNYRLVADIILLNSNSKKEDDGTKAIFGNGFSTVSYSLIEKPFWDIAVVSIRALIKKIYAQEKEIFHDKEEGERNPQIDDILERLGISKNGHLPRMESIFSKQLVPKMPAKESLRYLPFRDKKEINKKLKAKDLKREELNKATLGALELFIQQRVNNIVDSYLNNGGNTVKLSENIRKDFCNEFAYIELLYMRRGKESIRNGIMKNSIPISRGGGDSGIDKVYNRIMGETEAFFYDNIRETIADQLMKLIEDAEDYDRIYDEITKEVDQWSIVRGELDDSVDSVYSQIVERYVEENKELNEKKSAFPELFRIGLSKEAILSELWKIYCKLCDREQYNTDFEKELDLRLQIKQETDRIQYITQEIKKELDSSVRLGMKLFSRVNPVREGRSYYLINNNAMYSKDLEDDTSCILFDNNRTDCIEELQIYRIDDHRVDGLFNGQIEDKDED